MIIEKGYWSALEGKWEINVSSILSKLINEAGRWCEHYASDLFIQWKYNIDIPLENGSITEGRHVFAMRDMGVDNSQWYENNKGNPYYYRAVWFVDVHIDGNKIEMILR